MRRNRRVKIVATLGPASAAPEMVERLFLAGVDVFRINMSHSTGDAAKTLYNTVRACAARHRHPIGILADLQGPKFRIGEFSTGRVHLPEKSTFILDREEGPGSNARVHLPHPQIFDAIKPGHALLLDDGKLRMTVIENTPGRIVAEVTVGGMLASRKGISMPDTLLGVSPLTDKDKTDLATALKLGVDWVALSFVQRAEDVHEVRRLIGTRAALLSKIEKPSAVADLENVIAASDGIMVARGDLGVELGGTFGSGGQVSGQVGAYYFGQTVSYVDGLLPPEATEVYQRTLAKLQSSAPTVSFDEIRAEVERALGKPLDELYTRFEETPVAAASIGQVHRAWVREGDVEVPVAVKVQFPSIAAALGSDLKNLDSLRPCADDHFDSRIVESCPSAGLAGESLCERALNLCAPI